ncbi:transglycosylase domain-containing protein [uncultured Microbacterium sp.]|uniref:transglycosylase domain-containing protein n=1 Tax=uncultured Microbacterium sp. TaxID=191216 RepID=UPI0025DCB634|nr:transglycosylase domain-containing protein [uncultured Microbacterium sp.]
MPQNKRSLGGAGSAFLGLIGLSVVAGVLVTATVTPALAVSGAAASGAIDMFDNMPSELQIDALIQPTEIFAKDSAGNDQLLATFYDQNRVPLTADQVPQVMKDAILSSEDPRYYDHGGIDLIGTSRAFLSNLSGGGATQGGSSISQQYVKNVLMQNCEREAKSDDEFNACYNAAITSSGIDGIERKLQEMKYAIALEQKYSKDEILLGYLNIAAFGGTTYGIGAAAKYYFNVDAQNLSLNQAATLAGMVQAPTTYRIDQPGNAKNGSENGYAITQKRRNYVLDRMLTEGKITQEVHDQTVAEPITPSITPTTQGCGQAGGDAFFCDYVRTVVLNDPAFGDTDQARAQKLKQGGLRIYTTLDRDLQNAAEKAMSIVPPNVAGLNFGASATQVEVGTGRVLTMVQNRPYSQDPSAGADYTAINYNTPWQNGGSTGHPAGSTYKMFSLVNWLEQGHSVNQNIDGRLGVKRDLTSCDGASQSVKAANHGDGVGNFQNNSGYIGSPYRFTTDSLNSGFLAMAQQISVCSTNKVADRLGVTGSGPSGDVHFFEGANNPYEVLGSNAVAPLSMAAAYAAVAANGIYCEPKAIDKVLDSSGAEQKIPETDCSQVLTPQVAATAAYTLQNVMNGTGIGARIGDGVPVIGKTGIHEYEHTWMDGASTKVATVVWTGNVDGHAKLNEFRVSGYQLSTIRNQIWPKMQGAANKKYGGDKFPDADPNLTKQVLVDLPNVVGLSVADATTALQNAGFQVTVADTAVGVQQAGNVESMNPAGGGQVASGMTITITPSDGTGVAVPANLIGMTPQNAANAIRGAGFSRDPIGQCTASPDAPDQGVVTSVNPGSGTVAGRGDQVTIAYNAKKCS